MAVCGSFWGEKQFLLIFVPFYCLNKKGCLQQIQIFFWICPISNLLRKTNVLVISYLFLRKSLFWLKREVFSEFPRKRFKTTGKHSLAVCGSFWEEKQFLLIFAPIYWFDQKMLFKQIQIFLLVCTYLNLLRKTNFLSISVFLSEIVTFLTKKVVFSEVARKCIKTTEKHSLAECGSFWGAKQFLIIFVLLSCFVQKGLFTTNPNFPLDLPLF